jgi:anti-sigma factor RsiW
MSADRDNLEDWLREHPEANDDLADLPHLRELYQSACSPEPDEAAWNAVRSRIHDSLVRVRSPRPWWSIAAGAVAAAILAVVLARSLWTTSVPEPATTTVQLDEEPFPVVEADDVSILSMDARDVAALVVGEPPIGDDLEFARPQDIRVIRCERCPLSGRFARLEKGDEVPMFVAAAAVEPGND